ncbi:hypothetical protein HSR121_2750 [Halapricum desulfuricans]|uniref:Uncharacterized protein n=1 Tax=Halapricum desulfuricans TaxID=2841257 RepID=A0A897MY95_9EURY|nr:hypothetical protein HSR121_2750 [Halapricum desulfuricans]
MDARFWHGDNSLVVHDEERSMRTDTTRGGEDVNERTGDDTTSTRGTASHVRGSD